MHASFNEQQGDAEEPLERAIVLLLLAGDGQRGWAPARLADELEADMPALERALERLSQAGVVTLAGADARASQAARRIDELGLIGI